MRRIVSALLVCCFVANLAPQPAAAMSTQQEIALGKQLDQEVDDQSVMVSDPFLSDLVNSIGAKLAAHRARTDVTYHFEIIDSNEVNSFAMPGGYVHVDMGLLNFVTSDDELAGVMGHEVGHIERRHVVTLQNKANILSILIGVLSVLSPIGYFFGGTAGDLAYMKFSRIDELQADQYGLMLMSEAGYDPQSMVDTFVNLAQLEGDSEDTDKYFRDHPAPSDRVSHLLGYPEFTQATEQSIAAVGVHDELEGRFTYSQARLQTALAKDPTDSLAQSYANRAKIATSEAASGDDVRVTASAAETDSSPAADAAAALARADNVARDDLAVARDRAKTGGREVEAFTTALEGLSDATPNLGSPKKKGNNLSIATDGLNRLTRDINGTIDMTSDVMSTAPGLVEDVRSTLKIMSDPFMDGPLTPKYQALLPWYPTMTAGLTQSADDLVDSIDRARAAISTSNDDVKAASDFLAALNKLNTTNGDIAPADFPAVQSTMNTALTAWDAAEKMALESENEMYEAQTRSLSTQITMNDLESSQARFDAYRDALAFRYPGVQVPDYRTIVATGVSPGELGCDGWYAYETKKPLLSIVQANVASGQSCIDLARHDDLFGESMEIAEGFLLQDYIEKPSDNKVQHATGPGNQVGM
ncbi:MAG TPA: M48 family metallopeptidase [Candidatus Eremiobacteraceae bacterium]|nr:M48 family metallopeptidase [Candidatus Eremiobacteraceae bacterium]